MHVTQEGPDILSRYCPVQVFGRGEAVLTRNALTSYLNSDHINRRTDDDKSLVMAIRPPRITTSNGGKCTTT
jgi:hypothetical protein